MKTDENITKVTFYYNKKNNDLFAFFPDTTHGTVFGESYSNVGQHSQCHILYVQESVLAKQKDYLGLYKELEGLGYNLEVVK